MAGTTKKSSGSGRILAGMEKTEFDLFKSHLQIYDFFSPHSKLLFSWDNLRRDGGRILARLDRVYAFASDQGLLSSHVKTYEILGTSCHSNHKPVLFRIETQLTRPRGARFKMNGSYLQDPTVVTQLKTRWSNYPNHLIFFSKIKRSIRWYKEMCIGKARERKEMESHLRQRLDDIQLALQDDPQSSRHQDDLEEVTESLQ
jgi:hypothetical protein